MLKSRPNLTSVDARKGFTLIEVLVAMVIIFAIVTSSLLAYSVAMEGSHSAAQRLNIEKLIPPARLHVTKALKDSIGEVVESNYQGQTYIGNADLTWTAKLLKQAPPAPKLDPDLGQTINYQDRYFLFDVQVRLFTVDKQLTFSFQQLAWTDNLVEVE